MLLNLDKFKTRASTKSNEYPPTQLHPHIPPHCLPGTARCRRVSVWSELYQLKY